MGSFGQTSLNQKISCKCTFKFNLPDSIMKIRILFDWGGGGGWIRDNQLIEDEKRLPISKYRKLVHNGEQVIKIFWLWWKALQLVLLTLNSLGHILLGGNESCGTRPPVLNLSSNFFKNNMLTAVEEAAIFMWFFWMPLIVLSNNWLLWV